MSNERISYRIIANVGILAKRPNYWSKEVNVVSWNEGPAKLDIREWSPDHDKMSKGITLTVEETQRLLDSVLARDAIGILQDLSKPERSAFCTLQRSPMRFRTAALRSITAVHF